ncbi:MAG TPA: beta-propeller fold lactonase family protein, partial [Terriglobales bacterium]|nr:beta-propeller fold lactonase family protein [Terriglobales bacterium]
RINSTTGALTLLHKALNTGNEASTSFRDPKHRFLYVEGPGATLGSQTDIAEFRVNSTTGAITALPGSPFGGTFQQQQLAFGVIRPDLKFAYILDFVNVNTLHIISMNPTTGAMVKEVGTVNIPGSGDFLFDLRFDPTGRFLYVAEGEANAIDAFVSNATTGALTPVRGSPFIPRGSVPTGCGPKATFCGGAVAITGNDHLYYVSVGFDGVSEFVINPNTGALTELPTSPVANPAHSGLGVRVAPNGKHLYVNAPSEFSQSHIVAYTINTTTGTLKPVAGSPFNVPGQDTSMDIDQTGRFLYTANGNTISGFHINSTTGVLTPVPGSPYSASGNTGLTIVH